MYNKKSEKSRLLATLGITACAFILALARFVITIIAMILYINGNMNDALILLLLVIASK